MTTSRSENMVLRTVYLPKALDQRLKLLAFQLELSKNELIRSFVQEGLDARLANVPADGRPEGVVRVTSKSRIQRIVAPSAGISTAPSAADRPRAKAAPAQRKPQMT